MSDSFFDMPSGYNDADLEMAALEEQGRIMSKRCRGFTESDLSQLAAGNKIETVRWYGPKDDRRSYTVTVRCCDEDEFGMIFDYSLEGVRWYPTARAARESYPQLTA